MELTANQMDALRELSSIGVGHAATAFSKMINRKVIISLTELNAIKYEVLCEAMGDPSNIITCVLFNVAGDIDAKIVIILPFKDSLRLIDIVLGNKKNTTHFTSMGKSVVKEVANILTGSYLTPFQEMLGFKSKMTIPGMEIDIAGAILSTLDLGEDVMHGAEDILLLKTKMDFSETEELRIDFLLVPKLGTIQSILDKVSIIQQVDISNQKQSFESTI